MIDTSVTHPPPTLAPAPTPASGVPVTRHRAGTGPTGIAGPAAGAGSGWSPARLAYGFYGVAATGAVIGQVWVALERIDWSPAAPTLARVAAVLPFALCLELLAMALAAMADQRQRLGERAYGLRIFSGVVAVAAVGIIVVGHWPHLYLTAAFGALSASAYLLWLLHSAARRRDALRAAGLLEVTAPAYGPYRRARHPILTARAAELARERGLDLHASLRAAELALRPPPGAGRRGRAGGTRRPRRPADGRDRGPHARPGRDRDRTREPRRLRLVGRSAQPGPDPPGGHRPGRAGGHVRADTPGGGAPEGVT
jgi:hypothetical protein